MRLERTRKLVEKRSHSRMERCTKVAKFFEIRYHVLLHRPHSLLIYILYVVSSISPPNSVAVSRSIALIQSFLLFCMLAVCFFLHCTHTSILSCTVFDFSAVVGRFFYSFMECILINIRSSVFNALRQFTNSPNRLRHGGFFIFDFVCLLAVCCCCV